MDRKQLFRSDIILFSTALIWGLAFVAQKEGMEHIGPFTFNSIRFMLGSITLIPIIYLRKENKKKDDAKGSISIRKAGLLAGVVLFLGASFQQIGIKYTTAGNAGFITSLYVIFTPILGVFIGVFPRRKVWVGAILASAGLYFLTVKGGLKISSGDLLVLVCAIFYALHVQVIGWLSPKFSSLKLALWQFVFAGMLSIPAALIFEMVSFETIYRTALPLLYVGILSTGVAFTFQIIGQKKALPSHTAIILSFEAVFAAIFGWLLLNEEFSLRNIFGCFLMLAGIIVAQLTFFRRESLSKRKKQ